MAPARYCAPLVPSLLPAPPLTALAPRCSPSIACGHPPLPYAKKCPDPANSLRTLLPVAYFQHLPSPDPRPPPPAALAPVATYLQFQPAAVPLGRDRLPPPASGRYVRVRAPLPWHHGWVVQPNFH